MADTDTSIYQNLKPVQIQQPDYMHQAGQMMQLGTMGMQQMAAIRQMQTQMAMRKALANNVNPQTGQIDQQGALTQIAATAPYAIPDMQGKFNQMNQQQAQAQQAKADAIQKALPFAAQQLNWLAGMPEDARAQQAPGVLKDIESAGLHMPNVSRDGQGNPLYDPAQFQSALKNVNGAYANQQAQANVGKTQAETALAQSNVAATPAKIAVDKFGTRSPDVAVTNQYDKQVAPIRQSGLYMNQMLDAYQHPSPQAYASMVLNAYRIKFPNVPDVNSLDELQKSQAVPDYWKQLASKAINGLDQPTMDNLMRDAAATFNANTTTLRGTQQKYSAKAAQEGINDPNLTSEPSIEDTVGKVQALQKKIGPYVPPPQRGGVMGALTGLASKITGSGGAQSAHAAPPKPRPKMGAVEAGDDGVGYVYMGGDPSSPKSWMRRK